MPLLFQLQFTGSIFLWLIACIALGIAYAFLLYPLNSKLDKKVKYGLFAIRALVVSVLSFLLFAPLLKTLSKTLEKPLIILVQDNSASIKVSKAPDFDPGKFLKQYKNISEELSKEYEVREFNFDMQVRDGLKAEYNGQLSNISEVFRMINDRYANRNIGAVLIATDGIYNRGSNPLYEIKNLKAPIYTIALGDTIPKKDILIANTNYNNIAYLGNNFQIEVSIEAYQSAGSTSRLSISDDSGVLFSKNITINSAEFRQTIPLNLPAKRKGIQRYQISVSSISGELSLENNKQTIFVEVLDGRQEVLIIANAPHPDVAAIRQSIEINKDYRVKVAFTDDVQNKDIQDAGLVILHQLPSVSNHARRILDQLKSKSLLFILGAQSSSSLFSSSQGVLTIVSSGSSQEARVKIQPDFYGFSLSENLQKKLLDFAPLVVPFGNYAIKGQAVAVLNQKIGNIDTAMPLLLLGNDAERKTGVLAGEGLWRWRLEEFAANGNHDAVNELLGKTVQYLSSRDDKRKFRVYTGKKSFDENEPVVFNAELYNDSYELINTPDVKLSVKSKSGKKYSYLFSRSGNAYLLDAGVLPSGEYTYQGNTTLGSKRHESGGQFVVSRQQTELQQTTANHQLLYSLAKQGGGSMIFPDELSQIPTLLKSNENVKTISYEGRKYEEMINLKIIFFLIICLLSIEWFSRKRNGEI
ncbi:hypothetical protein [Daejeonella oryzae]|uniref:hypothetical protein n=1 Tax=Daejeonella oryzae TaxID=1122943 RepID=UPI000401CE5E|nr:hypothetical protein [Daejeonella oryzae]